MHANTKLIGKHKFAILTIHILVLGSHNLLVKNYETHSIKTLTSPKQHTSIFHKNCNITATISTRVPCDVEN